MYALLLALACCPFVVARYETVDCTILVEDPAVNRQSIKTISSCVTSVNPYNQVEEESYCTTILSNNTNPESLSTIRTNDQAECLVMAISSSFDTEFCTVTFSECLSTGFAQIFDCNIALDCRANRPDPVMYEIAYDLPSLTENESSSTTSSSTASTTNTSVDFAESTTTTTNTVENTTTVCVPNTVTMTQPTTTTITETQPITVTETDTDYVTITIVDDVLTTSTPIITTTEIVPITSVEQQTLVCCWDSQCRWHSTPSEWCSQTENDCILCGGIPKYV